MPRPRFGKAKDFKSAIKNLLVSLKPYIWAILISIVLVIISTVFTLIGPNKLSKITDFIEEGLSVNIDLSAEQMASLERGENVDLTQKNFTLRLSLEEGVVKLYIPTDAENFVPIANVNYDELKESGFVNFDGLNMGLGFQNGVLQIWANTEGKVNIDNIFKLCVFLCVLYLTAYVINFAQGFIMATVTQKVSKDLRAQITNKINRLPLKYFDGTTYGDVLSRVTNDVDTIGFTLNGSVNSLFGATALFLGSLIMMFVTNWIMALSGVLATLLGFMLMVVIVSRSQKYFIRQQQCLGQLNGFVEEAYSGQEIIKAYNAESETSNKFEGLNSSLYLTAWKSQFFSGLMGPLMGFIGNFGYVVVCVVGAVLVHKGAIDFSVIIAIMIYIRLFTQPLSQLAQSLTNLQSTAAASERVFEFLNQPELENESHISTELKNIKGEVEFRQVKFGYSKNKLVIKDFSALIKPGQKVAIVGPTGAGKTTLVNLLMKFYNVTDGDILIDGISIKNLTRANVHDIFGMVLQDTWLFQGSVKENIRYNKTGITDEQIVEACKVCGIHHFIKTLPNGYDTILDDNTTISAGQKQLLTIARAMVENAPMLILDEATSSVDTRTEILIQQAMDRLTKNRTAFVIAHRLSTIKNADLILVLKDGDIVEQGNHETLLKQNGFYAELYNSQFEQVQ